jgi:hypothetical protein
MWDLQVLVLGQRARNIAFGLKPRVSGFWCLSMGVPPKLFIIMVKMPRSRF